MGAMTALSVTTALAARTYGRYSVGELSGWIAFSHQIGSAVVVVPAADA
jgi:hypothetical protein